VVGAITNKFGKITAVRERSALLSEMLLSGVAAMKTAKASKGHVGSQPSSLELTR